jgi:hypothetical protein
VLRVRFAAAQSGRFSARIVTGRRVLAAAATPARAGRLASVRLRATRAARRWLARGHGAGLRARVGFTPR